MIAPNFFWRPTVSLAARLAMNMKPDHPIYEKIPKNTACNDLYRDSVELVYLRRG